MEPLPDGGQAKPGKVEKTKLELKREMTELAIELQQMIGDIYDLENERPYLTFSLLTAEHNDVAEKSSNVFQHFLTLTCSYYYEQFHADPSKRSLMQNLSRSVQMVRACWQPPSDKNLNPFIEYDIHKLFMPKLRDGSGGNEPCAPS